MEVVELYNLAKWVNKEIGETGLSNQYKKLHLILRKNPRQFKTLGEEPKNVLFKILKGIDFTSLTKDQEAFLDDLNISFAIGLQGIGDIENTLFSNQISPIIRDQEFRRLPDRLDRAIAKMAEISNGLKGCVRDEIGEHPDEVLIRVGFFGNASISNVEKFKNWGDEWYNIGYGITMAHGVPPQDIKIVGATRGSVILEFLTNPEIAITMGGIILWSQEVILNAIKTKNAIAETRRINLESKMLEEIIAKIKAEAKIKAATDLENNITSLLQKLKLEKTRDGDKISALKRAISILFNFNKQGGDVRLIAPKQVEDSDKKGYLAEIRKITKNIRVLEDETKSLEDQINRDNQKRLT